MHGTVWRDVTVSKGGGDLLWLRCVNNNFFIKPNNIKKIIQNLENPKSPETTHIHENTYIISARSPMISAYLRISPDISRYLPISPKWSRLATIRIVTEGLWSEGWELVGGGLSGGRALWLHEKWADHHLLATAQIHDSSSPRPAAIAPDGSEEQREAEELVPCLPVVRSANRASAARRAP